jgi:protein gp37
MHERFNDRPFSKVTLHPDRLEQPLKRHKPARIGVCFSGDLFHLAIPMSFIAKVFNVMRNAEQHQFLLLTKRPHQMAEILCDWKSHGNPYGWVESPLPNVWAGVSIEDQATADEGIPLLLDTPATLRYVSYEPALGPVDFCNLQNLRFDALYGVAEGTRKINWVICGGESGPGARPMNPVWARSVRDQCRGAGVPFFMKQMSGREPIPADLNVREMPKTAGDKQEREEMA